MSTVRVLVRDVEILADEYTNAASSINAALDDLETLVHRAGSLLAWPLHPNDSPVDNLHNVSVGLLEDKNDLLWRLDWVQTHDNQTFPDGTINLFDFVTQAEQQADLFTVPEDLVIPGFSPLQAAEFSLNQIRGVLDTAKHDQDRGIGTTVADGIWSTEDLETIIANSHGYYTAAQVRHAQTVLTMAQSSPEAREILGITQSGNCWSWDMIGHVTLDVLGMVPLVGNAADGINATWYAAQGQWLDAALSSMALIPGIGQAVTLASSSVKTALRHIPFNNLDQALTAVRELLENWGILRRTSGNLGSIGQAVRPQGWSSRIADNGSGTVFQRPGAIGNEDMVRVMEPTDLYPNGYVRFYNEHGQPIGLDGKPGSRADTHIGIASDGSLAMPLGWFE